jgi:hypothetical protein
LKELQVLLKNIHRYRYSLVEINNPTEKQKRIYDKWLDIKQ